jgi:hypothetical protein
MASIDYTVQDAKGIQKVFNNASILDVERYINIPAFNIKRTNEFSENFTSTEGLSGLKKTAERGTPDVNSLGDGYLVSLEAERYTNSIQVTTTDKVKMKDNSVEVRNFLTTQQNSVLIDASYNFLSQMVDVLNNAFNTTYYAAPDALALCSAVHAWNSSTQTFDNTTTAAFDETAVEQAQIDASNILSADAKEMGISYDTIIVRRGSANANLATRLFASGITPTEVNDVNIWKGQFTIVELPLLTAAYWFMLDTSKGMKSPIYRGVQQPASMQEPIREKNLSVTSAVEGFWSTGINNMPFNLMGSTGAA